MCLLKKIVVASLFIMTAHAASATPLNVTNQYTTGDCSTKLLVTIGAEQHIVTNKQGQVSMTFNTPPDVGINGQDNCKQVAQVTLGLDTRGGSMDTSPLRVTNYGADNICVYFVYADGGHTFGAVVAPGGTRYTIPEGGVHGYNALGSVSIVVGPNISTGSCPRVS